MRNDPRLDPASDAASRWYRACSIEERIAGAPVDDPTAVERGRELLATWARSAGITERAVERWIAALDVERTALEAVLGEDDDAAANRLRRNPPRWLVRLCATLGSAAPSHGPLPDWPDAPEHAPLLATVEPLVAAALHRLRAELERLDGLPCLRDEELLAPIRRRLLRLVERASIVELHAARMRGQLPSGDAAAFAAFAERLCTHEGRVGFLLEYPVLARTAAAWVDQWHDGVAELARALVQDADAIASTFGPMGDGVTLTAAESDPHRGGRHVWFVDGSTGTRIVFKPRPLAVEARFQVHVARLDALGMEPALPTLAVVDAGDHGWMERVVHVDAADGAAVRDFHRRQGAWLVVLWSLACSDVHHENTIAVGDSPVPVDHETLLRTAIFEPSVDAARMRAEIALAGTIMGVDLLPAPRDDAGFVGPVDHGGMGSGYADAGEIVIDRVLDAGSAAMRVGPGRIEPELQPNRVTVGGRPVDARDHVGDVERGIRDAWSVMQAHRAELEAALDAFEGAPVRCILRPTQSYLDVLESLAHPWYLGSAVEREHALLPLFLYPDDHEWRAATTPHERRQLMVGDVPWFGVRAGCLDLQAGDGATIRNGAARSGLDIARERHHEELRRGPDRDLWVARASLARWGTGELVRGVGAGSPPEAAAVVDAIARRLVDTATVAGGRAAWWGIATVAGGAGDLRFRPTVVEADLYDGVAGIAAFLAAHAAIRGSDDSRRLARAAAAGVDERAPHERARIGAWDGASGVLWMQLLLGRLLGDADAVDRAEAEVAAIARGLDSDAVFDVVSGAAGAIPVLLELRRHRPDAIELAVRCGDHLVAHVPEPASLRFARGFSHGATGIAWSLARLAAASGEGRFADHAEQLLRAEDALLLGGRWNDDEGGATLHAWCHGAPGIALGRTALVDLLGEERAGDPAVRRDAVRATVQASPHDSHGLCHGELGTVQLLDVVGRWTGDDTLVREADRRRQWVLEQVTLDGVRCTTPRCLEVPGLMTGLAGIGWELLRGMAPDALPPLLVPGRVEP